MESDKPFILIDHKPGAVELWVRGGCGAALGLALAFALWVRIGPYHHPHAFLIYLPVVVASAILAAKFGDLFWESVANFLKRLWWL